MCLVLPSILSDFEMCQPANPELLVPGEDRGLCWRWCEMGMRRKALGSPKGFGCSTSCGVQGNMGTSLSARTKGALHGWAGVFGLHSQHKPPISAGCDGSLGTQWRFSCRIAQLLWIPGVDVCLVNGNGPETHLSCEMMGTGMASSPNSGPQGSAPSPEVLTLSTPAQPC